MNIHASILKSGGGAEYVVLVTASPASPAERMDRFPYLSCTVAGLSAARERRMALIDQLRADLSRDGIAVRAVRLDG